MKTKTIKQAVLIKGAKPHDIYELFMDSKKHAKLVDSTAEISREIGGKFEIYDGYIEGTNIDLVKDKKIVQHWRGEEECWPKSHYSTLNITFEEERDGTTVNLIQQGVPEECFEDFETGWHDFYWRPMQELFK